jgi:HAD superfamily hydrolase (TIGR01490 family)
VRLALFDLDNTLLDGDSDVEWSELLARYGAMDAARTRAFHDQYDAGTLDIDEFLRFQLAPLAREPMDRLLAWRQEYVRDWVRPRISQAARALVREHARAGHELVMITATNRFITEPIAEEFGIAHLVATEPERVDGRFTGGVTGVPCYREGKITRLDQWLASRGIKFADVRESWFYSDSHNDLPLLSRVTHAIAVNADPKLAQRASERGWKALDLRRVHAAPRP